MTMRTAARHAFAAALVLVLALLVAACGEDGSDPGRAPAGADTSTTAPSESSPPAGEGARDGEVSGDAGAAVEPEPEPELDDEGAPPPTAAARAAGRGLERLAAAFAPVSARINFLVAAETLRVDAVESRASDALERERAGVVRIEAVRMQDVLDAARPKVAAVRVRTSAQQQAQQLLLEAIDARHRAMDELLAALDARSQDLGDSVVKERIATWRESWEVSLRATREATTTTQDARTALGLAPAREGALR